MMNISWALRLDLPGVRNIFSMMVTLIKCLSQNEETWLSKEFHPCSLILRRPSLQMLTNFMEFTISWFFLYNACDNSFAKPIIFFINYIINTKSNVRMNFKVEFASNLCSKFDVSFAIISSTSIMDENMVILLINVP